MIYDFIIDSSRKDKDIVCEDIKRKIQEAELNAETQFFFAKDRPDAERHVTTMVFLHPKDDICFVACGDFTGQVAAGLVGATGNKYMAILDYGITEDLLKSFPDRDLKDLKKIIDGEVFEADMIKINDDYALNIGTIGLSCLMAKASREHSKIGLADEAASRKALVSTLLQSRFNKVTVRADGKRLNGYYLMNCHFANGQWCGGHYHCAPEAVMNDGLLDIALVKCVPLFLTRITFKMFETGDYYSSAFKRRNAVTCRAKHVELDSDRLIYLSYDGEMTAATHIEIDALPKAIKMILPRK